LYSWVDLDIGVVRNLYKIGDLGVRLDILVGRNKSSLREEGVEIWSSIDRGTTEKLRDGIVIFGRSMFSSRWTIASLVNIGQTVSRMYKQVPEGYITIQRKIGGE